MPEPSGPFEESTMAFAAAAPRSAAIAEINVTPLVDVMLVLLIIFMLATPLLERPLLLGIGPADTPPPPPQPEPLELTVNAQGAWLWQGEVLPAATVRGLLQLEASRSPQPVLRIAADGEASTQAVLGALAAAKAVGLDQVALEPR
jgi:biopolymer transport protein ExbD